MTDISSKSLSKAEKNFENSKFNHNVLFCVGDGFEALNKNQSDYYANQNKTKLAKKSPNFVPKVEDFTVIIAGMGGQEIIKILSSQKNCFKNFVLEPQKNILEVRQFLIENNFKIEKDFMVKDGKIFYNVLKVSRCEKRKNLSNLDLFFGKSNFNSNQTFVEYLDFEISKCDEILKRKNVKNISKKLLLLNKAKAKINKKER